MTVVLDVLLAIACAVVFYGTALHVSRRPSGILLVALGGVLVLLSLGGRLSHDWAKIQQAKELAIQQCLASAARRADCSSPVLASKAEQSS